MPSRVTPAEIIAQRGAGFITTEEMMGALLSWSYSFGSVVYVDSFVTDAYISGDWDDICMAFYRGELTDDEFQRVADYAQHQTPASPAGRHEEPAVSPDAIEREQVTKHVTRLLATAYDSEDVATGLGITASQVAHKRVAGELWAIPDGSSWRFPACQFDIDATWRRPMRQVRGLARVLSALPADLHPVAVDGFLHTSQPGLYRDRPQTPLEWLRGGGDISSAETCAAESDWYSR
ncbi:hypothetical protein [Mycolicibacterium llatzerense]|uniref:hypothetical protein n=1 Tax=Mycolicibacterium llatzerense TaxID=280871 RepID=UPI0021B5F1A8|nr:hypothetical protein [Mycolicibacterium llatzerense]